MSARDREQDSPLEVEAVGDDPSPWIGGAARVTRALLALYLLPVIALVLIVGGLAAIVQKAAQALTGQAGTTRRRPSRFRHAPHVGTPVVRAWQRSAR